MWGALRALHLAAAAAAAAAYAAAGSEAGCWSPRPAPAVRFRSRRLATEACSQLFPSATSSCILQTGSPEGLA